MFRTATSLLFLAPFVPNLEQVYLQQDLTAVFNRKNLLQFSKISHSEDLRLSNYDSYASVFGPISTFISLLAMGNLEPTTSWFLTGLSVVAAVSGHPSDRGVRMVKVTDGKGALERTVFLPEAATEPGPLEGVENDGFILISDSSHNKFKDPEIVKKKVVKRRRHRKKPSGAVNGALSNNITNFKDPKLADSPRVYSITRCLCSEDEVIGLETAQQINSLSAKNVLNLFTIVRFGNEDCGEGGICYHQYECEQLGGTVQGPCAKGFGVCCTLEVGCGETTGRSQTLFVGGSAQGACTLSLEKMSGARQVRLDFYSLELESPVDGNCLTERLLIAGQNVNSIVPIICGANSGQHIHFDVDEASGPLMISVISPAKKDFRMKVSQLRDGDFLLAPPGCLQYYADTSGSMMSFNYQDSGDSTYLNNLNYAMCIKKGSGMCSVEYMNSDESGEEYAFDLRNVDLEGESTVPEGEAGAEVFNCPEDYLAIASVRLCGQKFNDASLEADFTKSAPVTDRSTGPFIVSFVSSPTVTGRGFRLQYQQRPC